MKCSEICALIEQEYGTEYACDWDNVGLLAGRSTKEVKKILLSLDATDEVVRMAAEGGYDMLITHHPMLFSAIKRVTDQDMNGRRLLELIRNDISYLGTSITQSFASAYFKFAECVYLYYSAAR